MNLKSQLQELSKGLQGIMSTVAIKKAIIPVMVSYAKRVKRGHFFVWTSPEQEWIVTTLCHRLDPSLEKRVVYAFTSTQDAKKHEDFDDPGLRVVEVPIVLIFTKLLVSEGLDSIIFFPHRGNVKQGLELEKSQFLELIKDRLRQVEDVTDNYSRIA
jgi:hypothetical protein